MSNIHQAKRFMVTPNEKTIGIARPWRWERKKIAVPQGKAPPPRWTKPAPVKAALPHSP